MDGKRKLELALELLDGMEGSENARTADGFDEAIVGVSDLGWGPVVLYSEDACLRILMERDGMTQEGAREFFDYNVRRSLPYYKQAPVFITLIPEDPKERVEFKHCTDFGIDYNPKDNCCKACSMQDNCKAEMERGDNK